MTHPAPVIDVGELREVVAETLDVDVAEVVDHAHFVDDLGVDSLMGLEIIVQLEKRYGVAISEAEFKDVTCFGDVRTLIAAKRAGA